MSAKGRPFLVWPASVVLAVRIAQRGYAGRPRQHAALVTGAAAGRGGGAAQQWWHSCVAAGNSFHRAAMLGKLDMVERVSLGRDSHEMVPLSPRIMPRAAAPRAPLYEENEEESVLERGLVRGAGE